MLHDGLAGASNEKSFAAIFGHALGTVRNGPKIKSFLRFCHHRPHPMKQRRAKGKANSFSPPRCPPLSFM